ncbi:sex hormone-binding globulin isoform X2 [Echeneis naucrates]|uniref:sex hormone-binding globulin isoform X2 n=1 Tax=Echeneis naucrates TaxID=173247 RepID=UPI001113AC41|nr:sex hormone-binding globulin isoform X2 [Echeneis naucrates]
MAVFCKTMVDGLLLTLSVTLLWWGADGHGNGLGMREVPGRATVNLGQDRDIWRPLIHKTVNLSEISSIKSSFQFRTYDPEGVIFYGDTKNGEDWFVLSLRDGIPLMQINKEDMLVSVVGGPKLNDGKWHTFGPQMDGCVREGNWLNLSKPWESEVDDLWPCYENIQPGSYFPGTGFAIFNTSVFPVEDDNEVKIELWGDFSQMDGTILSIELPGRERIFALVANNNTKEVTVFGDENIPLNSTFNRLVLTFGAAFLRILHEENESKTTELSVHPLSHPVQLTTWKDGHLAIGGLLGEGGDNIASNFLTGCLKKIQVQGKDLDLDLAVKKMSVSSHSCPA